MKFLFDLFPVILFFAVYKLFGIYPATATATWDVPNGRTAGP